MNDLLKEANEFRNSSIENITRCHKKYGKFSIITSYNSKDGIATTLIHINGVPFYRDDLVCNKQLYKIVADSICLHIIENEEYNLLNSRVSEKDLCFSINAKKFDFVRTFSPEELTQMVGLSIKVSDIVPVDRNIHI